MDGFTRAPLGCRPRLCGDTELSSVGRGVGEPGKQKRGGWGEQSGADREGGWEGHTPPVGTVTRYRGEDSRGQQRGQVGRAAPCGCGAHVELPGDVWRAHYGPPGASPPPRELAQPCRWGPGV